jgi:hypothetical protein
MPRYEYQCPECGHIEERDLPLSRCNQTVYCDNCFKKVGLLIEVRKLFNKLTTSWKDRDRKWGTSLYRSHDKGELVGKQKRKGGENG